MLQVDTVAAYLARLRDDPHEAELLFRELLIGVTKFFRDPDAFGALQTTAIARIVERKGSDETIRVWVPGCSTGEEAYSIIILLKEAMEQQGRTSKIQLFGTDLDDSAVAFARSGRYRKTTGVSVERLKRWFADWGISVKSVEIHDVAIPVALQDAMSRQAQAEREQQARVILGSAEAAITGQFVEAAKTYADHPAALQLRAMNIIYETTKERGATILMPTSMVDSMNPAVALALAGQQPAPQKSNGPLPLGNRPQQPGCIVLKENFASGSCPFIVGLQTVSAGEVAPGDCIVVPLEHFP